MLKPREIDVIIDAAIRAYKPGYFGRKDGIKKVRIYYSYEYEDSKCVPKQEREKNEIQEIARVMRWRAYAQDWVCEPDTGEIQKIMQDALDDYRNTVH